MLLREDVNTDEVIDVIEGNRYVGLPPSFLDFLMIIWSVLIPLVLPPFLSHSFRKFIRCLYAYNKIDTITIEDVDKLAREPDAIVISVRHKLNLEVRCPPSLPPSLPLFFSMGSIRVYPKRRDKERNNLSSAHRFPPSLPPSLSGC